MSDGKYRLTVYLTDPESHVNVEAHYETFTGSSTFRSYMTVTNAATADDTIVLESVTSWTAGFGAPNAETDINAWDVLECDNEWLGEGRWKRTHVTDYVPEMHENLIGHNQRYSHTVVSTGTWSTGSGAPMGVLESNQLKLVWLFQIEHNGAWRWEIGKNGDDGYLALSGPTNNDHSWEKILNSGESFTTVPADITLAASFDSAMEQLTKYRRATRTPHDDNHKPQVIFNDYMNTINGDPTTEKLLPLIQGASAAGVEVFVVDCGWYDDTGNWWPSVGEWKPSKTRFPNGFSEVMSAIAKAGMKPGLWVEPEVIGVLSPIASKLPDSAFLSRHGHRIEEQQRYFLDFRSPEACEYITGVIDRLINDFGVAYFKFDYNVSPGSGTDINSDSCGDGLLEHNRAYSKWIDSLHEKYPDLILENCSSGGMRMDYAQLSRFQVQSTSDQQDFRLYPTIAAAAPMQMLPEQAANWAYPQSTMSQEEIATNLNTTFLGRFFLSGYINRMEDQQKKLIAQAVSAYKEQVQPVLPNAIPFWPTGLPHWDDPVVSLGLRTDEYSLVTVWARNLAQPQISLLNIPFYQGEETEVSTVFPIGDGFPAWPVHWSDEKGILSVFTPADGYVSRTFRIKNK
ncbi:alpha-galactosidase [Bifidobacterium callitrichidarum]|uniref:alpha-galactosidase n=1 Tax=Bifidobacterium callitrichidarum TaxID=2052941 RepID=UPI001304C59B